MPPARNPLDRDRSRDLVVLKSGIPIKRIATPLARRFSQICTAVLADMTAEVDLNPLQYAALSYLFDEPDLDQIGLSARHRSNQRGPDHRPDGGQSSRRQAD